MKLRSPRAVGPVPAMPAFDPAASNGFMWIMAAMVWPKMPRRQREALATWHLDVMAHAKEVAPKVRQMGEAAAMEAFAASLGVDRGELQFMPWTAAELAQMTSPEEAYRVAAGGLRDLPAWEKSAADAPGTRQLLAETKAAVRGGANLAGHTLVLAATIAKHHPDVEPSSARAFAILAASKQRDPSAAIPDPRTLKKVWKEWRCVAPLWAASILAADYLAATRPGLSPNAAVMENLFNPSGRLGVLRMAAWLRDFGIRCTPRHAPGPLLSEAECPALPAGIEPLEPPLEPLADWVLAAVRGGAAGGSYRWNPLEWG